MEKFLTKNQTEIEWIKHFKIKRGFYILNCLLSTPPFSSLEIYPFFIGLKWCFISNSLFTAWIMSRKFSPNFEGSFNLGFGVLSFYTLHFEQFRGPKKWADSAVFLCVIFYDEIIAQRIIVKTHWVFLYSKVSQ